VSRNLDLVLEVGCEELPDDLVEEGRRQLAALLEKRLTEARLGPAEVRAYVTPRRLAAVVRGIPARQPTVREVVTGPPRAAAVDADGRFTRAAEGFARGQEVAAADLIEVETPKGPYMAVRRKVPGRTARSVLPELLPAVLSEIHWAKAMRWGAGLGPFARPVRWICAVAGGRAVPFEYAGVRAGSRSRGHRFLAPKPFSVTGPDDYLEKLAARHVVLDTAARAERIAAALEKAARDAGGRAVPDPDLVAVTAAKTEWPVAVVGRFDADYLELPREVLVTSMREHQDDFAVEGPDGKLQPLFVAFADNEAPDMGLVARGNERVLRARLDDARFFYKEDRKRPLVDYAPRLNAFLFQEKLGSVGDKARRITDLARELAPALGADPDLAARAAALCKCDLVTGMVYEFPELQGVMGRIYALADGEPEAVAMAIEAHYRPRFAGDDLPEGLEAVAVALADKLDTLVGIFGVGLIPSGSQDPYALRRAGLGVVQMLAARPSQLDLDRALNQAMNAYSEQGKDLSVNDVGTPLYMFLFDRLSHALREEGLRYDVVIAALNAGIQDVYDAVRRARALDDLRCRGGDFDDVMTCFRRVVKIIPSDFSLTEEEVLEELLPERLGAGPERALWDAFVNARTTIRDPSLPASDRLAAMATLRPYIDSFFEAVLVMDPEENVRRRRLSLLREISRTFNRFADFGQVVVA
jgi:glycyl-tRNA synthetase beta chain